jgi:DNA-directed RNA polymerase specialized sigma24 family protein
MSGFWAGLGIQGKMEAHPEPLPTADRRRPGPGGIAPGGAQPSDLPARGLLEAWLWRIVANAAKDSARRRQRARDLIASLSLAARREVESVEDAVLERMRDADLHDRLRLLKHRDRTLLALRYGVGLDTDEVGAAVGLNSVGR